MAAEETPPQRLVAGVWCGDVLARLPDYEDGTLDPARRAEIEAHLAGCDWCERFGGAYLGLIGALRRPADPLPADLAERLRARLRDRS